MNARTRPLPQRIVCRWAHILSLPCLIASLLLFSLPSAAAAATPVPDAPPLLSPSTTGRETPPSGDEAENSAQPGEASPEVAFTEPARMNVRSGPGTNYRVISVVTAGTKVEIVDENADGSWVQARIADVDETVWLAKWLLRFDTAQTQGENKSSETAATDLVTQTNAEETATAQSTTDAEEADTAKDVDSSGGPVAVTQPAHMNVRSGPGLAYTVVTTVPAGTRAQISAVGPQDQWFQVTLEGLADPAWLYQDLTVPQGSLADLPQLSEEEIPPRPQPAAQAAAATVASAPLPSGGGSFGYGVQAHVIHTGQEGVAMDKTRELGFTWMKQQIEWKIFESNPGQYGFGDIGPIVGAANLRGINLLFSVVGAPDWAREPGFDDSVGGPPQDPQTLANFVAALAREYCGSSLKAIEVWNEQNLHYEWGNKPLNPADYMNLLRPAYAAIKNACPSMLVISGAPTPAGDNGNFAVDDFRYLEGMFQNGLADYADGIGAHPSGYNVPPSVGWQDACAAIQQTGNSFNGACDNPHHSWSFRSTMEGYRNIAVKYGAANKRIWVTEFGWAAGGAFDPRYAYADDNDFSEQAQWTVEAYQMMKNWGWVGPAILWNLNFRVVADGTEKAQWGIVKNDWSPLPVFSALRDMPK